MPNTEVKKKTRQKAAEKRGTSKSSMAADTGKYITKEAGLHGGTERHDVRMQWFKKQGDTYIVSGVPYSLFSDRGAQRELIKEGLPVSSIDELREMLDVSEKEIADTLKIAQRTLGRRKAADKFNVEESEKVLRLMNLVRMAFDLFKNGKLVQDWFSKPNVALGNKTPLEYADTEPGAREVEDLLGRLAHGVFS